MLSGVGGGIGPHVIQNFSHPKQVSAKPEISRYRTSAFFKADIIIIVGR